MTIARLKPSYQIFVDGAFRDGSRRGRQDDQPGRRAPLAEVAEAGASDVDDAVAAARRAFDGPGRRCRASERGKYLFRIARAIQERGRELAVLESLDNGKPIRESRDVDVPLAAAHFFYYAGWADKLELRRLRPGPAPDRRRRPDHPVELPAADGGVEDRARAGLRATRSCSSRPRPRR